MPAGMDKHWGKLREALKQREIKGDFWVLGLDRWQRDSSPRGQGSGTGQSDDQYSIAFIFAHWKYVPSLG